MLVEVRDLYRQSKKNRDNLWTEWVSRPPAALVVWAIRGTGLTPNQVSFLGMGVFVAAMALLVGWRSWTGLVAAGLVVQLSYVLDCADGMLARHKGLSSPVGAILDFMLDEIKAFLLISGAATRLWLMSPEPGRAWYLVLGLGGVVAAGSGIALTTLTRRPEYREAVGLGQLAASTDRSDFWPRSYSPVAIVEAAGRLALHYPSWLLFVCLADRLDVFLCVYLAAHTLSLGRVALTVLVRLGRPQPAAAISAQAAGSNGGEGASS